MDNDLSDISLVDIIENAINKKEDSVFLLLGHPCTMSMLDETSDRLAREFKLDRSEIRDAISDTLCKSIHTIDNRNHHGLDRVLAAWCNTTGRRWCINKIIYNQVRMRYSERVINENTRGRIRSVNGHSKPLQMQTANSPEEILLDKEQLAFLHDLPLAVVEIVATLEPEDINIMVLWSSGKTLKEIHEATGMCLPTVGKHLAKCQKLIIKRIGLQQLIDRNSERRQSELRKRAYKFIRTTIQKTGYFENFPPKAA